MDEEEIKKLKEQIIEQIDSWHASDEQKAQAKEQIKEMDNEKFAEFLAKNNAVSSEKQEKKECPFCLINEGKIAGFKIAETKEALAVLEINPLSRGHIIIIPRKHEADFSSRKILSFARKIAKKIKKKLKAKDIAVNSSLVAGHQIVNIIPDYGEKQERKKAGKEELEKLQSLLKIENKARIKKEKPSVKYEKAPVRFP